MNSGIVPCFGRDDTAEQFESVFCYCGHGKLPSVLIKDI